VVTLFLAFLYKVPKVRLVGKDLWFKLAHVCSLAIVAGLAGSGRVFPSGLTALTHRMDMI